MGAPLAREGDATPVTTPAQSTVLEPLAEPAHNGPMLASAKPRMKMAWFAVLFFAIAAACSIPRFGQRENEALPAISDSDLFIDMAHVFAGDAPAFNPQYFRMEPHHYNRPLLAFLAGYLGKYLLHDKDRKSVV